MAGRCGAAGRLFTGGMASGGGGRVKTLASRSSSQFPVAATSPTATKHIASTQLLSQCNS